MNGNLLTGSYPAPTKRKEYLGLKTPCDKKFSPAPADFDGGPTSPPTLSPPNPASGSAEGHEFDFCLFVYQEEV